MATDEITRAQEGFSLGDILAAKPKPDRAAAGAGRRPARGRAAGGRLASGQLAGGQLAGVQAPVAAGPLAAGPVAAPRLSGPFLSPGSLTASERLRLIDGIETIMAGAFTHLPLKRARYGVDPIQRLRILRTQVGELSDDAFHAELADIVTRLRDAHTRYTGPEALGGNVAVLPFIVEMAGSVAAPSYVVTKVGKGLDPAFEPGVTLEFWNGVPIDLAVQRYSEREVGGRPDTQRAWATQSLTARPLRYGPPPDEYWVVIGYRTPGKAGTRRETKIDWKVIDPNDISQQSDGLFGQSGTTTRPDLRRAQAVNPAAEAVRRARMLLFAPRALVGKQAEAPAPIPTTGGKHAEVTIIDTELTETLKAQSIDAPGGPFGYLRIYAFNADPDSFIDELVRLIPLLPDRGLIIDIRGNPGGYIWAAELALQLFTPNEIQPTRFSVLATPFTRDMAARKGSLGDDLAPWKASLDAAVRNGELYAQPIPITDPSECNARGQQYGGPVVLVGDATTYSAGDLFTAGFVDNAIGPFVCVGSATGAGGANVWTYDDLKDALTGSPIALPMLPDGIGLSFAFRRATRSGASEGLPIEDVGIEGGEEYAMSLDDLLLDRRDLISHCLALLRKQPFSQLHPTLESGKHKLTVKTDGLDRLDVLLDGHPGSSHEIGASGSVSVTYPGDAQKVELIGFADNVVRQRRRITV
jgi:hypothetical protein